MCIRDSCMACTALIGKAAKKKLDKKANPVGRMGRKELPHFAFIVASRLPDHLHGRRSAPERKVENQRMERGTCQRASSAVDTENFEECPYGC